MRSPFKFLDAYTRDDREHFFGRDEEINTLYQMVFKTNLVLVYGLSGTGKTSLVQCGLANRFDDTEWYPFLIRRENNINDSIFKATKVALGDEQTDNIVENIRAINENYYRPVYLLFDQFEEIFIIGSKEEQLECMANIKALIDANLPCKIILIMREEYIGRLYPYEQSIPTLFDHRFRVEAMGPVRIKDVIASSFDKFNIQVEAPEDKSIQLMVDNLSDENNDIALPYLQVYLDILYREEYARTIGDREVKERFPILPITRAEITELGKIDNVLNKFLDEQDLGLFQRLKPSHPNIQRNDVADVLDTFVTEEGTKLPISITRNGADFDFDVDMVTHFPNIDTKLIKDICVGLESARLLHISNDSIELAHDSLASLIEDRRSEEQKLLNQIKKRLIYSFDEYNSSGTFLSRPQLASFEEFLPSIQLSDEISNFIKLSEQHVIDQEKERVESERKQFEAEQEIKKAELTKQKLAAEKKAKRRLGIVAALIALLLPIIAYQWYVTNNSNQQLREKQEEVDRLLDQVKTDNLALTKLNSELNFVKQILDTINQTGVSGDSLYMLVAQAVSSIDALKEDKVIEEVEDRSESNVVMAFTTDRRNGTTKKQTYNKGETVYVYTYLHIPRGGDNITMMWLNPEGKVYYQNSIQMGYNWEEKGGLFWDAKGQLRISGEHTIEILNGKSEKIHEIKFKVP